MIHIFFCSSAAGTFRQLLDERNIGEQVIDLSHELDLGPISDGNLTCRQPWLDLHVPLDFGTHDWLADGEARFIGLVENDVNRLVWIAPASAVEQSGLYWYLSKFGGQGMSMAIADYPFGGTWDGKAPLKLGELGIEPMRQLYDQCPRIPWDATRFPEDRWTALIQENALVRIVENGELRSAPNDYFDNFLLTRCPAGWTNWHRVMGEAMGDIWATGQTASSFSLLWRLRVLIETGQIACNGDLPLFGSGPSGAVKICRKK